MSDEPLSLDDATPEPLPKRKKRPKQALPLDDHDEPGFWSSLSPAAKWGVIGGVVLTVFFMFMIVLGLSNSPANRNRGEEASVPKKIYTRAEFRTLLIGKTQDEVLKLLDKPNRTSESGAYTFWYYDKLTKDPITEKIDFSVQVCFRNGRVESVNY